MSTEGKVPAGFYKACRAVAGSQQYAVNPSNGNEQIALDIYVPELERTFTTFLHFTDLATPYALERLRACGWKGEDVGNLEGIDSADIEVQVKYESYQGKERMKVDIVTGGGGRVKLDNLMDDKQKRAFSARMKAFLKANPAPANGGAAKGGARREGAYDPGPPDGNDDFPV